MNHHIGHRKFTQIEHAAKHVPVESFHVTFTMQKIDSTAQFLACGQDLLIFAHGHPHVLEQPAHERFDCHQHRAEQFDEQVYWPCNREGDTVGCIECRRL